jgi:hypothetical protein
MIKSAITKEEYWNLIQSVLKEENYNDVSEKEKSESIEELFNIPEKLIKLNIDATNIDQKIIKEKLPLCKSIIIGNFMIQILNEDVKDIEYNICIYETITKTASGIPCKIQQRMNILKDNRFANCPYLKYFSKNSKSYINPMRSFSTIVCQPLRAEGTNIPENDLLCIIKWLKIVTKLPAFI